MIEAGQVKFHVASLETRQVMRHYQVIINDDLVNDENAFSEVERANISRKWKLQKSILTKYRKFKVGTEIDIGTPYHHKDLMSHLMKNVNTYRKFIIPYALPDENGTLDLDRGIGILTMPEMFCWEDFQEKRQEMGPSLFGTQYELKVVDDLDRICEEKWLRYWAVLPKNYQRIFVIDPSGVGDKEDPGTGVFGCDIDPAGYVYVIYAEEVSTTPYQLIKLLEQIRSQYDPDEIYMEKEKYSDTIADTLQHLESKLFFSFVEHKGRTKGYRIGRIKQFMETGRVLLGRGQRTLEDRLLNHPDCPKHLLDAMAYALEKMNPPKRNIERDRNSSSEDDFEEELKRAFVYRQEAEVMENDSIF
uniref:Putative terminase n=1 Tax=viral metagenome TaxID=1070528 RepID=A0A6M3J0D4_9ZZZZ